MREQLQKLEGQRKRFTGIFERYSTKPGYDGRPPIRTILLKDIQDCSNKIVSDHIWITEGLRFQKLGTLNVGDKISFDARVTEYYKGYINHNEGLDYKQRDYRLSFPTNVALEPSESVNIDQLTGFQ